MTRSMKTQRPAGNPIERRRFLATAAAAAAAGTLRPESLDAGDVVAGVARPGSGPLEAGPAIIQVPPQEVPAPVPLGNGEAPAMHFQAYPGGTGALMEKLWHETGGNPFERSAIDIEAWSGPVPTSEQDLAFLPVHRLAALLRAREITSAELTEVYLDRLKRLDPVLLCAVTILEGRAREEARQADAEISAGDWRGPLHGIPYGVKDLFAVSGTRTTWGAADFRGRFTREDSEVVVRLRDAGAVLAAKLATGEFARGDRWYRGRTLNPWNLEEGSSGSSAGPGSATAAGCVAFAIGTETQGSIVSPSRRCGLTALRPTFGRVSRYGGMVLSWSMDKTGPMCRSALDCALVFNAIHGSDEKDPGSLTTPFRFDPAPTWPPCGSATPKTRPSPSWNSCAPSAPIRNPCPKSRTGAPTLWASSRRRPSISTLLVTANRSRSLTTSAKKSVAGSAGSGGEGTRSPSTSCSRSAAASSS